MQSTAEQPLIHVNVQCEYLDNQSAPDDAYYAFAYHIEISNRSEQTVQLLNRQWVIMDANGQVREIQGDGVIGEQPVIAPAHSHFYSSWSVIHTPVGCMQGKYGMRIIKKEKQKQKQKQNDSVDFYAEIPVFTLAVPGALN